VVGAVLMLAGLLAVSHFRYAWLREHFLLLHTLVEMFAVLIAVGIFVVAWYSRPRAASGYLMIVGVAYLFVGLLDLLHTLAYKNMGVFDPSYGANLATCLWVAARQMEAASLLLAVLLFRIKARPLLLLGVYAGATALLLASIFAWDVYPTCFVENEGLTPYKIASEYAISAVLVVAAVLLYRRRKQFDADVLVLLIASMLTTVASELAFTLYTDPYGPWNFWGHVMKALSFYFIFRALILTGFVRPQALLWRRLQRSRDDLARANARLEARVLERTARLADTVDELKREACERQQAHERLEGERRRLFSVLRLLPSYVCLRDGDRRIRFANDKFLEFFGDPYSGPCHTVFKKSNRPCDVCPVTEAIATGTPQEWEWTDAEGRTFHAWAYRFIDSDGSRLGLELGVDMTARQRLESEVLRIAEAERRRFGQDLHDSLGQILSGAACMSGALRHRLAAAHRPEADDLGKIETILNESIDLARSLARGLDLIGLKPEGLMRAMNDLAGAVEEMFGVDCAFHCDEPVLVDNVAAARHLYRIAQEAASNAVKHGKAKRITISLTDADGGVTLEVADDGVGLEAEPDERRQGLGLRVMEYRARAIGATFAIRPGPGRGTVVSCRMPHSTEE
jgi:signal transduction histidine kinase